MTNLTIRRLAMLGRCWPWLWLAGALLLPAAATWAADAPAGGPPMRELQAAPDTFVRGAPLPPWAQRQAVPPTQRKNPVVMRLRDTQVRIGGPGSEAVTQVVDQAIQVNDSAALGQIGQYTLEYIPQYQRLNLHSVRLLRGDAVLDRTASVDVRFLERETGFERGVYSGAVTVAIVIPDVRVGDTLSIAFVTEGTNPVFGGRFFDTFSWDMPTPTEWRRFTLSHPAQRSIGWRLLGAGAPGSAAIAPVVLTADGMTTLRFEQRGLEALADEPFVPIDHFMWRLLQVSEFASWNEVARWTDALFPPVATLPDELQAVLARLAALPTAKARVAGALQWVQGEIRNFSVSIGESSHRPHAPDFVLGKRYGDCKDKTYLLLTMLRQLGVEATPMLMSLQAPRAPEQVLPSPWPFDHVLVQARVDGQVVYLEPTSLVQTADLFTIAQPPPWMPGLVATTQASGLTRVGDTVVREPTTVAIDERMQFDQLGPQGTLQVRKVTSQGLAELIRRAWPMLSPEQRRQAALEDYEKRLPGIQLTGDPQPIDDLAANRFGFSASFTVPQLAQASQGGWVVPYQVSALSGLVNLPPSLQRRFPLRATDHPMERRYTLSIQWPAQVSAMEDPSTLTMDGHLFHAETRSAFRGSRYEFQLRLVTKAADIAPADLPTLMQDLKRLGELVPGRAVVEKQMIGSAGATGAAPAAEAMRREMQERIDLATGAIRSGLKQGDDLALTHCRRGRALAKLDRLADALADTAEAVRIAPGLAMAWTCRGDVLYFSGDFPAAEAAIERALAIDAAAAGSPHQVLGMVRLMRGRLAQAAADFAEAAKPDADGDTDLYALLWQIVALQRAGLPLPAATLAAARQDPGGAWPRPMLAMLVGDLSTPALLDDIQKLQGSERTLTLAEAWFYIGEQHLTQGRVEAAREAFQRCQAQGITSYYEHVSAGFELARLKQP